MKAFLYCVIWAHVGFTAYSGLTIYPSTVGLEIRNFGVEGLALEVVLALLISGLIHLAKDDTKTA